MGKFLIDSNVISGFFAEKYSVEMMNFLTNVINQIPNISIITEIEVLSWRHKDKGKEEIVNSFVEDSNVLSLSADVVKQCVLIRRSKKIKTPDAIIAATAIVHQLTLITNDNDFRNIQKLKILDPFSI